MSKVKGSKENESTEPKPAETETVISKPVDGLADDVKALNDKIDEFKSSALALSPERQSALNEIQKMAQALATKITAS